MAHQAPHPLRAERAQVLPVDPHGVRRGELGAGGELQHPAQQLLRGARVLGDQAHPVPGPGHERGVARGETRQVQVHQRVPGLDRTRRLDLGGEPTALLGAAAALLGAGQRRAQHHPGREMGLPVLDDPPDLEHRRGGDPGDGHRRHGHARGLAQVDPGRGDQQRGQGRGDHAAGAEGADGLGAVHRDLHQAPGGLAQVAQLPLRPARGEDPLGGGDGVGDAGGEAAAGAAHASGLDQRGPCPHQQAQPEHHQRNRHRDGEQRMQHDEGSQAAQDQRHPDGQRGDALGDPVAHPGEVVGGAGDGHAERGRVPGGERIAQQGQSQLVDVVLAELLGEHALVHGQRPDRQRGQHQQQQGPQQDRGHARRCALHGHQRPGGQRAESRLPEPQQHQPCEPQPAPSPHQRGQRGRVLQQAVSLQLRLAVTTHRRGAPPAGPRPDRAPPPPR